MKKIKRMNIFGFKKFKKFSIEFNDDSLKKDYDDLMQQLLDSVNTNTDTSAS